MPPLAEGLRYHHIGIPTSKVKPGEKHLPEFVKRVPHVAFEVADLEAALVGHTVLIEPTSPSEGIRVAFVVHDGTPVEFLEIAD